MNDSFADNHDPGLLTRVTGIAIDGNTLSAASVSWQEGEPVIEAVRTIELPQLVERVQRVVHPIFLDVDILRYVDRNLLNRGLEELFRDPVMQNPIVGVFPADCAKQTREEGKPDEASRIVRIERCVLETAQSSNPNRFPRIVGVDSVREGELETTRVWSARLHDVLTCMDQLQTIAGESLLGVVTGKRALEEVMTLICSHNGTDARTLINVGKLRSVYVGAMDYAVRFAHAIPVGLARDDVHYFSALPPVTSDVESLQQDYGTLFLPAQGTPSGLFQSAGDNPQIDCTRLGVQISRFAWRVVKNIWEEDMGYAGRMRIALSGRPSRLEGMKEFVSNRVGMPVEALDASPLPGIRLGGDVGWPGVTDHLMPVGAALAWFGRTASRFGMVLRDRRPLQVPAVEALAGRSAGEPVFILQQPPQSGSRIVARLDKSPVDSG